MRSVPDSGVPLCRCQAEIDEKRSATVAGIVALSPFTFATIFRSALTRVRKFASRSQARHSCQGAFPAACFSFQSALDGDVLKGQKAASGSPCRLTNRAPTSMALEEELRASRDRQTDNQQRAGSSWVLQISAPGEQAATVDLASMTPCPHPSLVRFVIFGIGSGVAMPEMLPTDRGKLARIADF